MSIDGAFVAGNDRTNIDDRTKRLLRAFNHLFVHSLRNPDPVEFDWP
jgi:hypothetical protein